MELDFKKVCMNDDIVKQISLWKYEDDYVSYNLPSYEEMKEHNYGMVNPEKSNNYICYIIDEEVIAYTNMKEMVNNKIFFGIGLRPDFCGKGIGNIILLDSLKEIKKRYPNFIIFLEVRSWNKRAIRAYEKVGFNVTNNITKKDRLGNDCEFTEMEYQKY